MRAGRENDRASLAGIALALRALSAVLGRQVSPGELVFARGRKPRLISSVVPAAGSDGAAGTTGAAARTGAAGTTGAAADGPDFSISHSSRWVGCVAVPAGRVGLDIESGTDARSADWVVREAAVKATGEGLHAWAAAAELPVKGPVLAWRAALWHVQRVSVFAAASACIVSSFPLSGIEPRGVPLEELFAS